MIYLRHAMHYNRVEKNLRELYSRSPRKLNDVVTRLIVVATEKGNNTFTIVEGAINAVPSNNVNLILIPVKLGIYR